MSMRVIGASGAKHRRVAAQCPGMHAMGRSERGRGNSQGVLDCACPQCTSRGASWRDRTWTAAAMRWIRC